MRVEVVRRGGLMGVAVRGSVSLADLPESIAGPAASAVDHLRFGGEPAAPRHPDSFRYEIAVDDGDERRVARLDEAELPAALRPLVAAALERGAAGQAGE